MGRVILGEDFQEFLDESPENKKGGVVDTNLLFGWDYDLHEWTKVPKKTAKS